MKSLLWTFCAVACLAAPSLAQVSAASRKIQDQMSIDLIEAPAAPAIEAVVPAELPRTAQAAMPLFDHNFWTSLQAPPASALALFVSRVPGLRADSVHEIGFDDLSDTFKESANRGYTALDLFTQSGLTTDDRYYVSPESLRQALQKYNIPFISLVSGKTKDGRDFHMQGMLLGGGKIEILYDIDGITYVQNDLPDLVFSAKNHVSMTIKGPADLSIDGISFKTTRIWIDLQELSSEEPGKVTIKTSAGTLPAIDLPKLQAQ